MSEPTNADQTPATEQLEAEIAETRDHLAGAVDELAAKLDVKAQAKEKVDDVKAQARATVHEQQEKVQQTASTLTDRFRNAGRPVQAALIGVPLVVLTLLIVRRARR